MRSKLEELSASAHDHFRQIWLLVTQNKLNSLDGESMALGRLMLEHPEYQYLWVKPYACVETNMKSLMVQGGSSPHIHLAIEATVLNQIEKKKPPEATKAYKALQAAGVEASEARHVIGRILAGVAWDVSHTDTKIELGYENLYLHKLKRVRKNPLAVVREQARQLRQVL